MREHSDVITSILNSPGLVWYLRVDSFYNGVSVFEDIPVIDGYLEIDTSRAVPDVVQLSIPLVDMGYNFDPSNDDLHPLGANGQRLRIEAGIEVKKDAEGEPEIEWFQLGWFVIEQSIPQESTVEVQAAGLLYLVQEARLINPLQPTGTIQAALQDVVEPAVNVQFDPVLVDRAVPSGMNFDEDRLGAFISIVAGYPAMWRMQDDGDVYVYEPFDPSDVVLELTDQVGGTVITAKGSSTRENAYNAVVARGTTSDGGATQGVAYDYSGPKAYEGPFNPLPVPYFFDSPLLTTNALAQKAAETRLKTIKRQTGREFAVEMVPNPTLEIGDLVSITTADFDGLLCTVEYIRLPLVHNDSEPMRLKVRSL